MALSQGLPQPSQGDTFTIPEYRMNRDKTNGVMRSCGALIGMGHCLTSMLGGGGEVGGPFFSPDLPPGDRSCHRY